MKAVEYYIDDQLDKAADVLGHDTQLTGLKTLVHFACTSEDINNLSIARCVKNGIENVWLPGAQAIVDHLAQKAEEYRDKAMLSLTHGQPATPTTLGKELAVYVYRLNRQLNKVRAQEYLARSMALPARSARIWPHARMSIGCRLPRIRHQPHGSDVESAHHSDRIA